jgi:hypothetical protein
VRYGEQRAKIASKGEAASHESAGITSARSLYFTKHSVEALVEHLANACIGKPTPVSITRLSQLIAVSASVRYYVRAECYLCSQVAGLCALY